MRKDLAYKMLGTNVQLFCNLIQNAAYRNNKSTEIMKNLVFIIGLLFAVSLTAQDYVPIKRNHLNKLLLENDDSFILSCGFVPDGYNDEGEKLYFREVKEDSVYDDLIVCGKDTVYLFASYKSRRRMTGLFKNTITSQSVKEDLFWYGWNRNVSTDVYKEEDGSKTKIQTYETPKTLIEHQILRFDSQDDYIFSFTVFLK